MATRHILCLFIFRIKMTVVMLFFLILYYLEFKSSWKTLINTVTDILSYRYNVYMKALPHNSEN